MRSLLIGLVFLLFLSCENNKGKDVSNANRAATDSANFTAVQWLDSIKNVGVLTMGQKVEISFRLKNIGDKPLYIISAEPSCGCTVAEYQKEAVAKGKEAVLVAAFDTNQGHVGGFRKAITVTTNTKPNGNAILWFEGEIVSNGTGPNEHRTPVPVETPKS